MKISCIKKRIITFMVFLTVLVGCNSLLFAAKKPSKKGIKLFVGKWVFHSVIMPSKNGESQILNEEEFLKFMPENIDQNDPVALEDAMAGKKLLIDSVFEISKDGNMYFLIPVPEGLSKQELDKAVAKGEITLRDGMMVVDKPIPWEEREGELWIHHGMNNSWEKCEIVDGILTITTIRFQRK